MDDHLEALFSSTEEIFALLKKLSQSHDSFKSQMGKFSAKASKLLADGAGLDDGLRQDNLLTRTLLLALIGALARSGAVAAADVAQSFESDLGEISVLFDDDHRERASLIAEQLRHPGFPDNVPPPRGSGPTLIVDNDS